MHSPLIRIPWLYTKFSFFRKSPNYEKLLYLRTVKKGFVVIDAGANQGYFTTLFSMLAGPTGEVHAFEPVPETYDLLSDNTKHLSCNLKINNLAVGQTKGKTSISYDLNDSEKASLAYHIPSNTKKCEVEIIPLDDYVRENEMRRLDFVKCDVEGFELQALIGMKHTLRKYIPQLCIEVTLTQKDRLSMLRFLKDSGYDSFRVVEKDYPTYYSSRHSSKDYFYLHAFSSKTA